MSNHGAKNIGDPNSTFGVTEGNPLWEELRDIALRVGPSFVLNVTLNEQRQITNVFAGDLLKAHQTGTGFVRQSAMQKVDAPFDVVVTTNSGYPLDLNLYQAVKGMSAGARILRPGGTLILACECREGVPAGSPLDQLLRGASGPVEITSPMPIGASSGSESPGPRDLPYPRKSIANTWNPAATNIFACFAQLSLLNWPPCASTIALAPVQ